MSDAIATMVKLMETLPEPTQNRIVDFVQEYLEEIDDEMRWDELFEQKQDQLVAAAKHARRQIAEGLAEPMDYDRL